MRLLHLRIVCWTCIVAAFCFPGLAQPLLDALYGRLVSWSVFRWSCFETIWTVVCFAAIEHVYCCIARDRAGRRDHTPRDNNGARPTEAGPPTPSCGKISSAASGVGCLRSLSQWLLRGFGQPLSARVREVLVYTFPILLLDACMVKKYSGVSMEAVARVAGLTRVEDLHPSFMRIHLAPLQTHRALPEHAPQLHVMLLQLVGSLLLYDAINGAVHWLLHRNRWLYRHFHAAHHAPHPQSARGQLPAPLAHMHPLLTNQLSAFERLSFLLTANLSLNLVGAHVLTRTLFVPVFMTLLIDSHCGFRWRGHWADVLSFAPLGDDDAMAGGAQSTTTTTTRTTHKAASWRPLLVSSVEHGLHHLTGRHYYAPFFTYSQHMLEWWAGKDTTEPAKE